MAASQTEKARQFQALHAAPGAFVIANAWDAGSARILASVGFAALATSSGAAAGVLGRRDGAISRDESLAHARAVVEATDLPVSADLEKGFGDTPEAAATTISRAGDIGLVGGSIEDATGDPSRPLFDAGLARERIVAAVEAARAMSFPFMLTARAEGFIRGNPDLDEVIRRLQAFEAAGADVLMAPGLPDLAAVRTVCAALSKPFNFMAGIKAKVILGAGTGTGWRKADKPCHVALSCGDDGAGQRSPRGEGARDSWLRRFWYSDAGVECFHARVGEDRAASCGGRPMARAVACLIVSLAFLSIVRAKAADAPVIEVSD